MTSVLLHTLPWEHPLRAQPLVGAHYRQPGSSKWHVVTPRFKIATLSYNQLGEVWRVNEWTFDSIP